MLSLIAFITIAAVVVLLLSGRVAPLIGLVLVPLAGALFAGFTPDQIATFFVDGITKVQGVVVMFIFAILFFGLMNDVGLFDPLIKKMTALCRGNVIGVAIGTVVVAAIAHLDGSGASTFLITIPALLPLYRRLGMSPYLLLLLIATSASIVNMVPWGGPVGRAAAVMKVDPTVLWRPLIPLQLIALVLLAGMAAILGWREQRRIAARTVSAGEQTSGDGTDVATPAPPTVGRSPLRFWLNTGLTLVAIVSLVVGVIPAGLTFMIATSLALLGNFPKVSDQIDRIRAHAPGALLMAAIILSAGCFLGIMSGTGMLTALARDLVGIMPEAVSRNLHLLVGAFGVPLELVLNTDAFYFALVPVVQQIVVEAGVAAQPAVYAMIIGNIIGTFISPFSPALWLALGLAEAEMGKHIRYSLGWTWAFSLVLLGLAAVIGLV